MSGRGGRGGWRGRGRGNPIPGAVARDEDGTVLDTALDGPPPLYPEMELPAYQPIEPKEELLVIKRELMYQWARHTPFYLDKPKQSSADVESGVERYRDREEAAKRRKRAREPMVSVIKLNPLYFPEELFSEKDKRAQRRQDIEYWKAQASKGDAGSLARLEKLLQMEDKGGAGKKDGEEGDEAPEDDAQIDTDDEEDMEGDDYYQGQHFDDDDGYDDGYDDGGDEGPVY